jgi:hypothetical protein
MAFSLSSKNVFEYLIEKKLCTQEDTSLAEIELKPAKNFNLLVSFPENWKLLVKQERRNQEGKTSGEFLQEWRIQEFLRQFPEMNCIHPWISEALYFDAQESIIVFNYLNDYRDLMNFYGKENVFPVEIAAAIGTVLATLHRLTLDRQDYQEFFYQSQESYQNASHVKNLERIGPEIFGLVPADGLKFFSLYQRYDSLGKAISELGSSLVPCCLVHNDLKLNNILLSNDWEKADTPIFSSYQQQSNSIVRFIDWERCSWGDPAVDLGNLVGSYLHIWLSSLVTSKGITMEESLRMATTPLEEMQPSLSALVNAYLNHFPEILTRRPNFLRQVVQFSGWTLITTIRSMLQYQKTFGNTGICMLQVAKSLLCRPEASIPTIFGVESSQLNVAATVVGK